MTDCRQQLTFSFYSRKPVVADFSGGQITSDAGLLAIRELDHRLGWTARAAGLLLDPRQASKTEHPFIEMFRQRFFALIAGYPDCNDHDRLREDQLLQTICDRPAGDALASQPTLSRFENAVSARHVAQLNRLLMDQFLQVHRKRRPKQLILDIDPTDDPCHGHQQLALFNGFYDQYMYLPVLVFERTSGMLLAVRLQAGNCPGSARTVGILKPLIRQLRARWPKVKILLRADAGLSTPRLYRFCEANRLDYLIGFIASKPLQERTKWALDWLKERFERTGQDGRWMGGFAHQAGTWDRPRRILYKAEVNKEGTNLRFLVTNCKGIPNHLWPQYNDRGTAETFIDDLKNGLSMDRLSCSRFLANAFRLLLAALAYNLLRTFRTTLAQTELETASIQTIRTRLIKVGARVITSVRRVWVHISSAFPLRELLNHSLSIIQAMPRPG
jgi:hypothetical protein